MLANFQNNFQSTHPNLVSCSTLKVAVPIDARYLYLKNAKVCEELSANLNKLFESVDAITKDLPMLQERFVKLNCQVSALEGQTKIE